MDHYTRYERARIIGARALQLRMGAPTLIQGHDDVSRPIDIAKLELEEGILPITVQRP